MLEIHLSSGSFMILRLKERVSSSGARRDQLEEFRFRQGLSLARISSILWLFHDPSIERACLVLGVHDERERVRDQLEEFRFRQGPIPCSNFIYPSGLFHDPSIERACLVPAGGVMREKHVTGFRARCRVQAALSNSSPFCQTGGPGEELTHRTCPKS